MKTGKIEVELMKARREAQLWHRIATRLYNALTDPDCEPGDHLDAIETYLNYHNPHDDN